ncbi:hypothetical protein HBDW_43650 [Herbaspirillum sp. DW155]|nr:hypothetical protein HBDW_43650 [Herbaspirillum sp. DW155]
MYIIKETGKFQSWLTHLKDPQARDIVAARELWHQLKKS